MVIKRAKRADSAAPALHAIVPRTVARYGWRPDTPDMRDLMTAVALRAVSKLPASVDLSTLKSMPPVYDQGQLGSCTGNAIAGGFEFDLAKQHLPVFKPSRLAIYYDERVIERTTKEDAGAEIRDGMKVIAKTGAAPETLWPYVVSKFAVKPSKAYYKAAAAHTCVLYQRVAQSEAAIKSVLAAGQPIVFGITVYDSFESDAVAESGTVPMPKKTEKTLGGHAILMVGYTKSRVKFRNSWGDAWGKKGYATLPLDYVLSSDLATDFWTIQTVK
ncbi:MAG TPA: C1 family peptidase [Gemmatimonadaceae bacterium]|jgi:C1A family cysteine protease